MSNPDPELEAAAALTRDDLLRMLNEGTPTTAARCAPSPNLPAVVTGGAVTRLHADFA